jgi:hypothetical protein
MSRASTKTRRVVILIGLLVISFLLYAAAESGSTAAVVTLLGLLVIFMFLAIIVG